MEIKFIKKDKPLCLKKAFSLIEMLVYIAILGFLLVVIINLVIGLVTKDRQFKIGRSVENSGVVAMEMIVKEIRNAENVDASGSIFGADSGFLALNSVTSGGAPRVVRFYILNQVLKMDENTSAGPVSSADVRVTRFFLKLLNSGKSQAVKIEMSIEGGSGTSLRSENFYSTVILRGSYN